MTYEEFLQMPETFIDDVEKVLIIKQKYRMDFTEQEKQINNHIITFWEETKINELRGKFQKCWDIN